MRAKYTAANAQRNNPELRERNRARMLQRWREDEAFRATTLEALRIYQSSPESRAATSARMKALWADPVWRARQIEAISRADILPTNVRKGISASALNSATDLMASVDRVVPTGLPDFIRNDVCQDLMVAVLEGTIKFSELKSASKLYLTEYRKMFPDKFGPLSIDAPIAGTDGLTIADTLTNETPHF
jgi:hypothetical protein